MPTRQGETAEGDLSKKVKSPSSSEKNKPRSLSPPPRSRAKAPLPEQDPDFMRPPLSGKIWNDGDPTLPPPHRARGAGKGKKADRFNTSRRLAHHDDSDAGNEDEPPKLFKKLETRAINQDQLIAEVKGIYSGLVMVETKCEFLREFHIQIAPSLSRLCFRLYNQSIKRTGVCALA